MAACEARITQLEQLVEAMRFTDREELVDTIDVWKRAYERICIARDEMEAPVEGSIEGGRSSSSMWYVVGMSRMSYICYV